MRSLPVVFQYSGQPLDLIHPGRAILGLAHLGLAVGANLIRLSTGSAAPGTDIFIRPEEMCFSDPVCAFHFASPTLPIRFAGVCESGLNHDS